MNIYELHAGSWKVHEDGSCYNYRELADELVPYVKEMGYTHVELMPLTEYPFDGSWGYQVTGFFAATSRYGSPDDLKYMINKFHENNIAVIMDWVPAHFPRDAHGLAKFDGGVTYEYADPRIGEHKEWGTLVFDYSKTEVISFLTSSAYFWAKEYHFDGLRVDAVSSMLYRDYGRRDGEWIANIYGGKENIEAIDFLRALNKIMFSEFPNILMIAEESTAWGLVTAPAHEGGLGFNYKWNMGWMNDTLRYMAMDPYFRKSNHNLLTFLMCYAYSENYILPLSHDEVVHGKASLINKMYGEYEDKFSSLKALFGYYMSIPGKKLMFMGGEFAQFIEWRYYEGLDWKILNFDAHKKFKQYVRDLNHFYIENKSFWQIEKDWSGFEWINENDAENSVISYIRKGKGRDDAVICILNFTPVERDKYIIGVPSNGEYEVVLNSDANKYGGNTRLAKRTYKAAKTAADGRKYSIAVKLPPLSAIYLKKKKKERGAKKEEPASAVKAEKQITSENTKTVSAEKAQTQKPAARTRKTASKKSKQQQQ
jgi:1,4-alpha-glucan branching enzyme